MRGKLRVHIALAGLLVLLALPSGAGQAQTGPIRIGATWPLTGPIAASGKDMLNGWELYLNDVKNNIGGRPVEFIMEDSGGVPANTLTKVRKLVERDHVHLLVGAGLLASEGYAVRDYIVQAQTPLLFGVVSADDLTQRLRAPYLLRLGWTSSQPSHPFADYIFGNYKYRRIAMIANDYAFSYEVTGGFHRRFEELGGCIVQKIWVPLNTPDHSPYVAQIRRDVDAVFANFVGADVIRFVKQYDEFGLKGRLPLIGGGVLSDESLLRSMGDEAIGNITALHWSAALDRSQAKEFAAAYTAKYGTAPSYYAEALYSTGRWLEAAARRVRGNVENKDAFMDAVRKVELYNAPRGPLRMDPYQNPIQNIYIRRVDRVGGTLVNSVIYTFPAISQFGSYKPEEFLANPVYGRDYPPLRPCK